MDPRISPTNPRKSPSDPRKSPTNPRKSPAETYLICIVCRETGFESIKSLVDHRSENHPYKCPDCNVDYKLTDSLRKHMKSRHNEDIEMTVCRFCDNVFLDVSQKPGHI